MTDLSTADALDYAKDHAVKSWYFFTGEHNFKAVIPDWRTGTAADGRPRLTAQVTGPGAAHALELFVKDSFLMLGAPGDMRPRFDYSTPGRLSCVWRKSGVWVELWHPNTPAQASTSEAPAPAPTTASSPPRPSIRRTLTRPGGRLPFTRRKKETPTA